MNECVLRLGCKYNLYPNKPILRHTIRGLVTGAATLAAPVAAVGAVALLAVGTPIVVPTYGTYRLVKHFRKKRQARRHRQQTESSITTDSRSEPTLPNLFDDDDDDDEHNQAINDAIQASIRTYQEELAKRDEVEL